MCFSFQINKNRQETLSQIERLLSSVEKSIRQTFLESVKELKSDDVLKTILRLLKDGQVDEVIRFVNGYTSKFSQVLHQAMLLAGATETQILKPQIFAFERKQRGFSPQIGIEFDPSNERAAQLIRETKNFFIRELSSSQERLIRDILQRSQIEGWSTTETAKRIQQNIGLTVKQSLAVDNYENLLRNGSKQALDRALRDRRYDRTVGSGKQLTEDQIQKMVDSYRQRYIRYRAEVISRTEAVNVTNLARYEALKQQVENASIPVQNVEREWRSVRDKRVRWSHDKHTGMDGQRVGLNDPFVSPSGALLMNPGDRSLGAGLEEVAQCRCTTLNIINTGI